MQHELPSFEFYEITEEEPEAIPLPAKPLELEYTPYEEERFAPLYSSLGEVAVTQILEPPVMQEQPKQVQKEIVNQTNVTEVTQIVETIYQEADFEPLPQMEFQAGVPETYGTLGYFGILLSILTLGLVPMPDEMV